MNELNVMRKVAGGPDQGAGRWGEFGHMPTNPIQVPTRLDAMRYFARLRLLGGQKILFKQSLMFASYYIQRPLECFEITRLDGAPLATLFISLNCARYSEDAPEGFLLEPPGAA